MFWKGFFPKFFQKLRQWAVQANEAIEAEKNGVFMEKSWQNKDFWDSGILENSVICPCFHQLRGFSTLARLTPVNNTGRASQATFGAIAVEIDADVIENYAK